VSDQLREQVREHYAAAAVASDSKADGCGCGTPFYGDEAPDGILSLGCGNPTAIAELREGETVLDLGSGAGLDVILSAKRVGPTGIAWGLDMTEEMLARARENAVRAQVSNAHFLKGHIEDIPLPAESVDVVISNCVVNLSTDKPAVFEELARVLKPGGRLGISDIVAEDGLSPEQREEQGSYVGCIAGALSKGEYEELLQHAGFESISVEFQYEAATGLHGATIKAVKPLTATRSELERLAVASAAGRGCC
jgi:arsenite methyltransferase